jgi:hypothetical protein
MARVSWYGGSISAVRLHTFLMQDVTHRQDNLGDFT